MPIPATASIQGLDIRPVTGGQWEATCGRCLKPSIGIAAVDAAHAWDDLKRLGWVHFVSEWGGVGYCICRSCAENPRPKKAPTRRRRR